MSPAVIGIAEHDPVVILVEKRLPQLVFGEAGTDAGQDGGVRRGVEDMPGFGLAVRLAVDAARRLVVGVEVDGQEMRGIEELGEDREVRAAPASADDLIRVFRDDVVQEPAGKWV